MDTHNFRRVFSDSHETLWKLCVSTKLPHLEIRWYYSILCCVRRRLCLSSFHASFSSLKNVSSASAQNLHQRNQSNCIYWWFPAKVFSDFWKHCKAATNKVERKLFPCIWGENKARWRYQVLWTLSYRFF